MMVLLPSGLRGRLILLLLVALLAAQFATLMIFLDERDRAVSVTAAEETAFHALSLARDIERLPSAERAAAVMAARSSAMQIRVGDVPQVDVAEASDLSALADSVTAASGEPGRGLHLAIRDSDARFVEGSESLAAVNELFVSAELQGDKWLNLRARLDPPPLQWAWPAVTSLALAALAVIGVIWIGVGHILKPMNAVAEAAARLGKGEKPEPLPLTGPGEAQQLAHAFNRMAEELTQLLDDRSGTLAAIGHDLRSPVTAMRLRVEMVDDDETRQRLTTCLDEIETLTDAALALARGGGPVLRPEKINLASLLSDIVRDLREEGLEARLTAPDPVGIQGDTVAIRQAIRNIADNAARYGKVALVSLEVGPDGAHVDIADHGPGIAPANRELVFSPFVRLEHSRSRDTGGSGLGLSIARAAIDRHGGHISLEDANAGGTVAKIVLPYAPSTERAPGLGGGNSAPRSTSVDISNE